MKVTEKKTNHLFFVLVEERIEEKFEKAIKPRLTIEGSGQEQPDVDEQDVEEDKLVADEEEDLTAEEGSGLFSVPLDDHIIGVSFIYHHSF